MNDAILITGVAGSGKSTMCRELKRRGYAAYDIENMVGLFTFVDKSTGRAAQGYSAEDPEWFERHSWTCNKEKLRSLILSSNQHPAFCCGIAANLDDLLPLFDKVFLLRVEPTTLRRRLSGRGPGDFGRAPAIQDWLLGWKDRWEESMRRAGAVVINADCIIGEVVDEVVRLTGGCVH